MGQCAQMLPFPHLGQGKLKQRQMPRLSFHIVKHALNRTGFIFHSVFSGRFFNGGAQFGRIHGRQNLFMACVQSVSKMGMV